MPRNSDEHLESSMAISQAFLAISLFAALGGVGLIAWRGFHWLPLLLLLSGVVLSLHFTLRLRAMKTDYTEGVVTERCYVQSFLVARRELLFVKTAHGTLTLANATAYSGQQLAKHWILLEYARHSQIALRAEFVDQ
jgi:hypothetical protein